MKLAALRYRRYPNLVRALGKRAENYNQSRRELSELEKEGKALIIAPENTADWRRTEKSPELVKKMYDAGVSEALENEKRIREFLS